MPNDPTRHMFEAAAVHLSVATERSRVEEFDLAVSDGTAFIDDDEGLELATVVVDHGPPSSRWGRIWYWIRWLPWRLLGKSVGYRFTVIAHTATTLTLKPRSMLDDWWERLRNKKVRRG